MNFADFQRTAERRPVLWAVAACWAVESFMIAWFGFQQGGGFSGMPASLGYATAFFAIAVIGAFLATELPPFSLRPTLLGRWLIFGLPLLACFALGQVSGWRIMGISMADASVARDDKATQGQVARDRLEADRKARAALGTQPDPSQIEQRIQTELNRVVRQGKTVAEISSNCSEPTASPTACRTIGNLRVQFEDAKRAGELDKRIAEQTKGLATVGTVAGGNPDLAIVARIVTSFGVQTSVEDVRFWLPVFIVGLIGFFATWGWALVGTPKLPTSVPPEPPPARHPQQYLPSPFTAPVSHSADRIDLNPPSIPQDRFGSAEADRIASPPALPPGVPSPAEALITPPATPLRLVSSIDPPEQPCDRMNARQIIDQLLLFRAACLVNAEGPAIPGDAMYDWYARWARGRAVSRQTFLTLFGDVAGVQRLADGDGAVLFGGVQHRDAVRQAIGA